MDRISPSEGGGRGSIPRESTTGDIGYNLTMSSSGFMYAVGAAVTWGAVYTIDQKVLKGASLAFG